MVQMIIIKNNEVFILWYGYDIDSIYTVGGTLGVFSEYEYAVLAKEKYSTWDIFIVHGLDNLVLGGCIKRTSMGRWICKSL